MVRLFWALACALTFTGVAGAVATPESGGYGATDPPQAVTHLILIELRGDNTSAKTVSSTIACNGCLIAHGQIPTKGLATTLAQPNGQTPAPGGAVHSLA